jgi:hypothetical protein
MPEFEDPGAGDDFFDRGDAFIIELAWATSTPKRENTVAARRQYGHVPNARISSRVRCGSSSGT